MNSSLPVICILVAGFAFIMIIIKTFINVFGKDKKTSKEEKKDKKKKIVSDECPKCGAKLTDKITDDGMYWVCPKCFFTRKM